MNYLRRLATFSIRDLLLITVIVALAVAWWLDRSHLAGELEKVERARESVFSFHLGIAR